MKSSKRPVNLSLNEDVVAQARSVTENLSEVVEGLLTDYVARERGRRAAHEQAARKAMANWNKFADEHGSFADEHSTL